MSVPILIMKMAIAAIAVLAVSHFAPVDAPDEAQATETSAVEHEGPCATCLSVVIF